MINVKMVDSNSWQFYLGLCLALGSNIFIGSSFIIKKKALIILQSRGVRAGAGGHGYLRQWMWWAGFLTMGVGEAANFVAYAFAPASVVTPLGALSIIVTAVLSSKCLNEYLNILGKLGCFLCILGSTVVVIHAPKAEEVESMDQLIEMLKNPGFIVYVLLVILLCLGIVFLCGPARGYDNVIIYVLLCSSVGSLTVMCCKGLSLAIKDTISSTKNQMNNWLTWVFLFLIIFCIMIQMNYLNKALDLYNAGIVTPIYYVFFTTFVIIASSILFEEWKQLGGKDILGGISGFFVIISAIFLLNVFKDIKISYKDLKFLTVTKKELRRIRETDENNDENVLEIRSDHNYGSSNSIRSA